MPSRSAQRSRESRSIRRCFILYIRPYESELYHYGVKGMKWGIRRTPEQLGRKASPKHRDAVSRTIYAKARVDRSKQRLTKKYNKTVAKEEAKLAKNPNDTNQQARVTAAKQARADKMSRLDRNAKINAGVRDVASWGIKSIAKSNLVPVGAAFVGAAASAAFAPATLGASVAGSAFLASVGVEVSNIYRGYQTVRNVMEIADVDGSTKKKR